MANEPDDELHRLKEVADANAKKAMADTQAKHAKVIEATAREGMHKQQLEAQPMRPESKPLEASQFQTDYERRQAAEAKREAIRLAARANEPGAVAREAAREENNAHVWQKPTQVEAASSPQQARQTEEHDAIRRAQQAATLRRQQAQRVTLPTSTSITAVQEAARLRREQEAVVVSEQRQRAIEGQHARRAALGAQRYDPLRETSDRRATQAARDGGRETSDRVARQQNRELTSEDMELRQSRKNSGKTRDREQEM